MRKALSAVLSTALLTGTVAAAAQAAAAAPVVQPEQGRAGVILNHDETGMVAGGPLPALLTMVVPPNRIGAGLKPDSELYHDRYGSVHASLRQVFMEAADHPGGHVVVLVNVPGSHGTRLVDVYQQWDSPDRD